MQQRSEEQQIILDTVRAVAAERVRPRAAEIDEKDEFPRDILELFAEQGILAPLVPEEYGGIGLGFVAFAEIIETIATASASAALILIAQADGLLPILHHGSEAQKQKFLPPLVEGKVSAIAITEPGAGSDVLAMRSRAVRDGDHYRIDGQKCFITNGAIADVTSVYAYTDTAKGARGVTAFVVEKGTPGLRYGKNENKMGMRGTINSELLFEDMRVPAGNRLGEEGQGFTNLMTTLACSRLFAAAQAVGLAQGAIDEAVAYVKTRVQFGKTIEHFQGIQFMVADMVAQTEAARELTRKAAWLLDQGNTREANKFCAMAKFLASDTAMKVTTDAVQCLGGYGYMKDYPVERMMRDAKLIQIYTGTNQIMRTVAAREIFEG
ncbi:MAG: acyl-CoA dehydrogenase family protein [Rhodocyclaceae bacterium]|nr:acyl-CoA dehydrogenase family protein [Rhodocyclaceae bacterium]